MSNGWDAAEREVNRGPVAAIMWSAGIFVLLILVFGAIAIAFGWIGEAADVAKEEAGPKALLKKYEFFITQAQAIEQANRAVVEHSARIDSIEEEMGDLPIAEWPRDIRQDRSMLQAERLGLVGRLNGLIAEYNARAEQVHWAFMDTANPDLSRLPRQYQPVAN